jgi:hypothetical protein
LVFLNIEKERFKQYIESLEQDMIPYDSFVDNVLNNTMKV